MKTISNLILTIALIAGFTSCKGDYQDWSAPQANPQEDQYNIPEMTVSPIGSVIEFASAADTITVGRYNVVAMPEGFSTKNIDLVFSDPASDGMKEITLPAILDNGQLKITKVDLEKTVKDLFGAKAEVRTMECDVIAYVSNGRETTIANCNTFEVQALLEPGDFYAVGAINGWEASAEGKICYFIPLDKEFICYTTKWTGDHNLKIWTNEQYGDWSAAYGSEKDGDDSPSGVLTNNNAGAIVCPAGDEYYTLKVNRKKLTYEWIKLENQSPATYEKIGLIGVGGDWNNDIFMEKVSEGNYRVEVTLPEGKFKFRADAGWDTNWGSGVAVDECYYGIAEQNGPDIWAPAGDYTIYLNTITGAYAVISKQ